MATIKTAISVEPDLLSRVGELASSLNISRSRVFALAVEDFLHRQENQLLLKKITAAYDDTADPQEKVRLRSARRSFGKMVQGER